MTVTGLWQWWSMWSESLVLFLAGCVVLGELSHFFRTQFLNWDVQEAIVTALLGLRLTTKCPFSWRYSRQNPERYYICEVFVDRSLGSWEEIILSQWVLNAVVSVLILINRPTEEDRQAAPEGRDWSDIATSQGCWQPQKLKEAGRILA